MIDYDFSPLNDKEFENLTIELISKERTQRYERFKSGRDGGIDGRFYHFDGTQEIVQCKHYIKTGFSGLISSLKKKSDKGINEIDKVNTLNPTKYIFITSIQLSADNKRTIKELFSPYIKNDNDIYGQEDLNQILGNNPDIEKRYYKLWLSSTIVLERIFNNAIETRSEFLLEDIKENAKYYAVTDNHNIAIDKLESSQIIIIAGEPGIGKTTLAEHMALWYVEKDYKFYNIEDSIGDAFSIYKRGEKQIFYFDDFLGSNYLNAIEDKKDSHIVKFMDIIKKDKTKRFILTSRTNIFNQGIALSDAFKSNNIESNEFIIRIDSLENIDKAMILYNHLWHSELDEKFIDEIYEDKRYKQIILHKNFNPRLIAFITDIQKIEKEDVEVKGYWQYIIEKLDNPKDVWKNTFDKQSDEFIRILVMLTVLNGNKIEEYKLRNAYIQYIKLSGLNNDSHVAKDFDSIIGDVVKYFLNRSQNILKKIEYTLFNPSIADFIINKYNKDDERLINSYLALMSKESLIELRSLRSKINKNIYESLVLSLYNDLLIDEVKDIDYIIRLLHMVEFININRTDISIIKRNSFFQNIINKPKNFTLIDEFVTIMTYIDLDDIEINSNDFILLMIENTDSDVNEINKIIELLNYLSISDSVIDTELNKLIDEYVGL
mgnify:FL=1